jgi:hypothetical protein
MKQGYEGNTLTEIVSSSNSRISRILFQRLRSISTNTPALTTIYREPGLSSSQVSSTLSKRLAFPSRINVLSLWELGQQVLVSQSRLSNTSSRKV